MLKISPDDLVDAKTLADRLAARPKMMAKVVKMLDLMENAEGDLRRADEAERQVIEIMRETGQELLSGWAGNVAEVVTAEARIAAPVVGHAKKFYWYTTYGTITVEESCLLDKATKKLVRPFSEAAGVRCRSHSLPLERAITDFGVDIPFG